MGRHYQIGGEMVPFASNYVSGTVIACGTVSTQVTVPEDANNFIIHARGGAIYYTVNGSSAGTASPGYAPQDGLGFIYPIDNLNTLHVNGDAAESVAHIMIYNE